jgi:dimethylargininase
MDFWMFRIGTDEDTTNYLAPTAEPSGSGFGGHSMVAPLKRVIVQRPAPPATSDDWERYGYTAPVDHEATVAEFDAFCTMLAGAGVELVTQEPDDAGRLDSIFVYDASIVTDEGALLTNPGKDVRRVEVDYAESMYNNLGVPVIGRITGEATLEGGDVFWLDDTMLAVGIGYRTNQIGADQLSTFVRPQGVEVIRTELPHWHGPDECLHLLSLISPVAERTAVVYSPLLSTPFMQLLKALDWTLIDIPVDEFASQGTNVLALAPGKVVMLEENVGTRRLLETAGMEVLTYRGLHLSHNRQGGPTCLTRPLWRDTTGQRGSMEGGG